MKAQEVLANPPSQAEEIVMMGDNVYRIGYLEIGKRWRDHYRQRKGVASPCSA